jgi:GNAT superfamily N-acetyltransferase
MSEILQDITSPALIPAMEANFAEEMATFGRNLPGAELHEDPEVQWFITGVPHSGFNGVLRTHFTDEGDIDAKIDALVEQFKARQVPMSWGIGPSTRPAGLGSYLTAHGFTHIHDGTGMATDLERLNEEIATPPGFTLQEIVDEGMLKEWFPVSMRGFHSPEDIVQLYYDAYVHAGFGRNLPWHHYLGRLNDEPVAISSLLLHAGVAGVYGVATIPEARRQGIGAAMTLAPLCKARSLGYRIGILSPSEMGLGVYVRLGFQKYCTMSYYKLAL